MRPSTALMACVLALSSAAVTAAAQTPAEEPFAPGARWRDFVVGGEQSPAVTQDSPLIATVDARPDLGHPVFAGGNVDTLEPGVVTSKFGTAAAAAMAGLSGEQLDRRRVTAGAPLAESATAT